MSSSPLLSSKRACFAVIVSIALSATESSLTVGNTLMSFNDAKVYCAQSGQRLVSIHFARDSEGGNESLWN